MEEPVTILLKQQSVFAWTAIEEAFVKQVGKNPPRQYAHTLYTRHYGFEANAMVLFQFSVRLTQRIAMVIPMSMATKDIVILVKLHPEFVSFAVV